MDNLNMLKKDKRREFMLTILFIIYLIMGYNTPEPIAKVVDTIIGKIVIFAVVVALFMHTNPILAVLGLLVAFDLMRRASLATGNDAVSTYLPNEERKNSQLNAYNQFPYTLEQEIVKKMAPVVQNSSAMTKPSFSPVLENLYDASPI